MVERRLAFGQEEKAQFRTYMRMNEKVFTLCRERFGEKRKSGARKLHGNAAAAAGALLSVRDLKKGIG